MKEKKDLHSFQSIEAIQKEEPLIGPRPKSLISGVRELYVTGPGLCHSVTSCHLLSSCEPLSGNE
jgi:hypothetical protein